VERTLDAHDTAVPTKDLQVYKEYVFMIVSSQCRILLGLGMYGGIRRTFALPVETHYGVIRSAFEAEQCTLNLIY